MELYLDYISREEREKMASVTHFLYDNGDKQALNEFIELVKSIYVGGLWLGTDNGNPPDEWGTSLNNFGNRDKSACYYTIINFGKKSLTDDALAKIGQTSSKDFPYYYGIAIAKETLDICFISYADDGRPNWNREYRLKNSIKLSDICFPLLKEGSYINKIDCNIHSALNDKLFQGNILFSDDENGAMMVVKDQHGNYTEIKGNSVDVIFRDYADNYTGYRNYRRQTASEWEIVDDNARDRYNKWKVTAKGLKSDFDKFYGSGIVD